MLHEQPNPLSVIAPFCKPCARDGDLLLRPLTFNKCFENTACTVTNGFRSRVLGLSSTAGCFSLLWLIRLTARHPASVVVMEESQASVALQEMHQVWGGLSPPKVEGQHKRGHGAEADEQEPEKWSKPESKGFLGKGPKVERQVAVRIHQEHGQAGRADAPPAAHPDKDDAPTGGGSGEVPGGHRLHAVRGHVDGTEYAPAATRCGTGLAEELQGGHGQVLPPDRSLYGPHEQASGDPPAGADRRCSSRPA